MVMHKTILGGRNPFVKTRVNSHIVIGQQALGKVTFGRLYDPKTWGESIYERQERIKKEFRLLHTNQLIKNICKQVVHGH